MRCKLCDVGAAVPADSGRQAHGSTTTYNMLCHAPPSLQLIRRRVKASQSHMEDMTLGCGHIDSRQRGCGCKAWLRVGESFFVPT